MTSSNRHTFFVTCAPGLEPVLHGEIRALRLAQSERQVGGVRFAGTMADAWRANLELRTAVRVLRRLARFPATDADALYRGVSKIAWSELLAPEGALWIDAQTKDSALSHSRFIAQCTKDAIVDQLRSSSGARPRVDRDEAELRLHLHVFRDLVTLSLDTSGASLHKRGWRRAQGKAPLAETLAAGMVLLSGWNRRAPLLDPFTGSGTIVVEAGLLASGTAPGLFRAHFAFESLPDHDATAYAALRQSLHDRIVLPRKLRLIGSDRHPERTEDARSNADAAGIEAITSFETADARDFAPRSGWNAWIATNPPYGERIGAVGKLTGLYRQFGETLRTRCEGYSLALLTSRPPLAEALGMPGLESHPILNGGLDCRLLIGPI
jgi:putative N6-adenine-specific DNA methylase